MSERAAGVRFDPAQLGTREDIKRAARSHPEVGLEQVRPILRKHGLGSATAIQPLGPTPYVTNFVHKILRHGAGPVVLKGQHRPTRTWDIAVEARAQALLRAGTDLPLPAWALFDDDRDLLPHAFVLVDWLPGTSTLDLYEAASPEHRLSLARQHGAVHRAFHDCPLPGDHGLPVVDLRAWRTVTPRSLFAGDAFHDALTRLSPDLEDAVRRGLDAAADRGPIEAPVLTWRDGSLGNTVARPGDGGGTPTICGVFDVQSALVMQPHWDLIKAFNAFVPGREPDRPPTPEWHAFVDGYGRAIDLEDAEARVFRVVYPALFSRHWFEITGALHPQTVAWMRGLLQALTDLQG